MKLAGMVAALALAGAAQAANQPHPTLDAIASEVAGYPATVHCEVDEAEWVRLLATIRVSEGSGFVRFGEPVAYIGPSSCRTLTEALAGDASAVPVASFAGSLLVLLHESVHLRGVRDEGETDCTALGLVKDFAARYFNYQEWTTEDRVVRRWVRVKRKVWVKRDGQRVRVVRFVRVRRARMVTVRVPDPELTILVSYAAIFHRMKSPEYQGSC